MVSAASPPIPRGVVVRGAATGFRNDVVVGSHRLIADEPLSFGGTDAGPGPYDLLLAALGSCTSMTLGLYARRKGWPLESVEVRLRHARRHAADCADCAEQERPILLDHIDTEIVLVGPALSDAQRAQLLAVAHKCPVHKTLTSQVHIHTRLVEEKKEEKEEKEEQAQKPVDVPPHVRNIGALPVRHLLPAKERRMVGPFIFLDHLGPATIERGVDSDVKPHPHIGLATVTYLFDGEIVHRDSLGAVQTIRPGEINWMTAGRGIVHSERATDADRERPRSVHGLQLWVALPQEHEDHAPEFHHYDRDVLPSWTEGGVQLSLLAGTAYGRASPVRTLSPLFYVEAKLPAGATLALPEEHAERAVYVIAGGVESDAGDALAPAHVSVFPDGGGRVVLRATSDAHLMLLGGAPLDGHRSAYWNFVSSDRKKIEQAKQDWRAGRFAKIPGDDTESLPLPEDA